MLSAAPSRPVRRIAVVVPAHDEATTLPACLQALHRSAARVAPVPVQIIVVADGCTDDTAAVAAAGGARVVQTEARNVGRARDAGMRAAMRDGTAGLWLAGTDADSTVDPEWLPWHHGHAVRGTELLAGTVAVTDWTPWPAPVRAAYDARYDRGATGTAHDHVHGANLGCAATTYEALGGFAPLRHGEDADLVARARTAGARVVHDSRFPVVTSARRTARAPHGFAAFLAALAAGL